MPNLNYLSDIVPQDVPEGVLQEVPQATLDEKIVSLIRNDNNISTEAISLQLNVSSKTIKRHIGKMPNVNYVGSGYSGHWEITDEDA